MFPLVNKLKLIMGTFILCMLVSCATQQPPMMRIGSNHWPGYGSLYLADDLNLLSKENIKLVEFSASTDSIYALRTGVIEAAALTIDEVLTLLQDGIKLKIVLVFDTSHGGDAIVSKPEIKNLSELKNKKIGVENTAVGAVMLTGALEQVGLTPSDVTIVPLTVDEHLNAFNTEKVDAIVTFEPIRTHLIKQQHANILFDSASIPNTIIDVLAIREEYLEKNPNAVKNLLQVHFDLLKKMNTDNGMVKRHFANRLGATEQEVNDSLAGILIPDLKTNYQLLDRKNALLDSKIKKLTQVMIQKKLLMRPVDTTQLLSVEYLPPL